MTVLSPTPSLALAPTDLLSAWLLSFSSHNTRDAYRRDLEHWGVFLDASGVQDPLRASRTHAEGFARRLELRGLRPASVARKLASVASFYRWCVQQELLDRSPLVFVDRPRVCSAGAAGLGRDELRAFLGAAGVSGRRDHALCLLLALTGLRVGSALGIDVCDLGSERGHRTVRVRGKGLKEQVVPLAAPVAAAVDRLLEEGNDGRLCSPCGPSERPADTGEGDHPQWREDGHRAFTGASDRAGPRDDRDREHGARRIALFTTSSGQRLDRSAAYRIVRRLAKRAGIEKTISPHSLRSSYCQLALDAGAALHDVQHSMAHSSPSTTIGYLHNMQNLDRNPTYIVASVVAE